MAYLPFTQWRECFTVSTLREADEKKVIKHLTHLEDLVLTKYADGAQEALQTLQGLTKFFEGHANAPVNLTVKIDGAPAIIAGNDPADGKFFVGTKGAFAKTPRIAKTPADLKTLYGDKPGLLATMQVAFETLKTLKFPHILQGDVLFTPTLKQTLTVFGEKYITFKPNTIIYGVPVNSDMGKKVAAARFGICFHTTYTGTSLATLRAEAGANIKVFKPNAKVVLVSSRYQDLSGTLTFTSAEHETLRTLIAEIDTRTRKMKSNAFLTALAASALLQSEFMIFQNSLVRGGEPITLSPKMFVARLNAHLTTRADAEGATKKTDTGKAGSRAKYEQLQAIITDTEDALVDVLAWQQAVISAKTFIIQKLNAPGTLSTFYSSDKGVVAGSHEGFVAVDHQGNFVKLVDRAEFSRLNLTQGRFR
jgi:hypothetical protein